MQTKEEAENKSKQVIERMFKDVEENRILMSFIHNSKEISYMYVEIIKIIEKLCDKYPDIDLSDKKRIELLIGAMMCGIGV